MFQRVCEAPQEVFDNNPGLASKIACRPVTKGISRLFTPAIWSSLQGEPRSFTKH